ncbi:hypothetical protein QM042_09405 [Escherichia coli]|uniref:YdcD family protein n=1 Tax=Escherichia coli TaxID=562 RepID=UPI003987919C
MLYATACGHVIFLITLCLFVVYPGIGGGINAAITYSEHKTPPSLYLHLSEKNIIYKIINDQKISRGVSNSVGVTVDNYRTHCGGVGGHFAYTYDILYSVRLVDVDNPENMEFCATKQRVYFIDRICWYRCKIINYGDYYGVDASVMTLACRTKFLARMLGGHN